MMGYLRSLPVKVRNTLLLCLGGVLLVFIVLTLQLVSWYWESSRRIAELEPRYARLAGLLQSEGVLREASAAAAQSLVGLVYPASADMSSVSAIIQQDVRRLLEGAGLAVSGSRVLEPVERDHVLLIPLELTAEGSMEGFERMLAAIHRNRPLMLIDSMELAPQRSRSRRADQRESQSLGISMRISVVKLL